MNVNYKGHTYTVRTEADIIALCLSLALLERLAA